MYKTRQSVSINRSPQDVFDYATDPNNDPNWLSGTQSSQWTSDPPHGVGSTRESVVGFLGRRIESTSEITHWDKPHTYGFRTTGGPIPFTMVAGVESTGENQAEMTLDIEAEFGGFFKLAEGLVGKQLDKQMEANLDALKILLEAEQE